MNVQLNDKQRRIIFECVETEVETYEDLKANDLDYDEEYLRDLKEVMNRFKDEVDVDKEKINTIFRGDLSNSLIGYIDGKIDTYHIAISILSPYDENFLEELAFLSYELQEWSKMRWELLYSFDDDFGKVNKEFIEKFRQRFVHFIEDADMVIHLLYLLGIEY